MIFRKVSKTQDLEFEWFDWYWNYMPGSHTNIFWPGCYGISENHSSCSTESSASTEPWFCDACKAGLKPVSTSGGVEVDRYYM